MTRGGKRPGAGRPSRGSAPAKPFQVLLTDEERAELAAGLRDGEDLGPFLRDNGLTAIRRRKANQ